MKREQIPEALRPKSPREVPVLALSVEEAAEAVGLCSRSLRKIPDLPRVQIGGRILIPVEPLRDWLHRQVKTEATTDDVGVPFDGEVTR